MTLPPWKPKAEEREAFVDFVISELEREDGEAMRQFATLWAEGSKRPDFAAKARDQFEAERLAKRRGGTIVWPEDKRRKGNPGHRGDYARAVRDVPRIHDIFRKYWPDKERRTVQPSAEYIAARRWNLSDEDTTKLHKKFQRP